MSVNRDKIVPLDVRSAPITVNTSKDGTGTEFRLICDSNGKLVVSGLVTDLEDDSIAAGQTVPIQANLLYGYESVSAVWKRIAVDSSGKLQVYTP